MDNLIYIVFVSIFFPLLLMALLVEKQARQPVSFMLVGIFLSVLAAEINGCLTQILPLSTYQLTILATPITEEVLKALPILFFALVITDHQETLFTAAMATGIGFAVLENVFYLLNTPGFQFMDAIIRAFGAGLMHGMCTLLVGIGISFVKKKRKIFFAGTFALLSTAIIYHGIYNLLIQSAYAAIGALLPIVTYVPFFLWRIRYKNKKAK